MLDLSLEGRVALVTGASRGIGRAIALMLAEHGADVAVNYRREAGAAEEVVGLIRAMGRRASAYRASVDDLDQDRAMVEAVVAELGPIGILVNNCGIASRGLSVHDTDPAELERVMRVHGFAPHYLAKLALPPMRPLGRGDIIMISSIATSRPTPNGAPYMMGKAAMEALAQTLALEERDYGIRTNIVCPTVTVTDMGARMVRARTGVEDFAAIDHKHPFGHVSRPEDVARVVTYLVSPANSYLNGQRINVDGGGLLDFTQSIK